MLFVRPATQNRVPTVYAPFEHDGLSYIIMKRVQGESLNSCWEELDEECKVDVTAQLKRYFDELRQVESPGYYGGIWEQQVLGPCLSHRPSWDSKERVVGPMETDKEWVEKIIDVLQHSGLKPRDDLGDKWLPYCQIVLMKGWLPVFTHGDIHSGNIILGDDGILTVIDWEFSGWSPACGSDASLAWIGRKRASPPGRGSSWKCIRRSLIAWSLLELFCTVNRPPIRGPFWLKRASIEGCD